MSSVKQYIKNPKFGQGDEPEFLPVGTTGIDAVKNRLLQVERQALNITIRDKKNYASLTEAIAAVTDDKYKVKGFQLQFSTDGKVWKHYLYNGDDALGWSSEDNWLEVTYGEGGSSNQYLNLSMFSEESGTLSDEDYQKVVKAYENSISKIYVGETLSTGFSSIMPLSIVKSDNGYVLSINIDVNYKDEGLLIYGFSIEINDTDKSFNTYQLSRMSYPLTLYLNGSGTKALTDNGIYAEFVPEAPADGKTYGRNNKQWVETGGGTQYLDLSMFSAESGTLSEEDYQKVVKAYKDKVNVGVSDSNYQNIIIQDTGSSYTIIYFIIGLFSTGGMFIIQSLTVDIIKETKAYTSKVDFIQILKSGKGTKALTDNGLYAEFASPIKTQDGGTGAVTKELQPNTFYKFGECSSLTITLAAEKSGILNEYMFEFISGSTPTTLTDIPNVKWQNGDKLIPEVDCTYQVSIVNNCAVYAKFPNA